MLCFFEVETPNNTSYEEWRNIVNSCRHYASVCGYSLENEMMIDEDYIAHLNSCADYVHSESDALFSPMSAMRGIEYFSYGDCCAAPPSSITRSVLKRSENSAICTTAIPWQLQAVFQARATTKRLTPET